MRLKFLKSVATMFALGLLTTACSNDNIMPEPEAPVEKDSQFYVNVTIANPAEQSTRNTNAADYEAGSAAEQKIHKVLFVFYNTSNKYVGSTVIELNATSNKYEVDGEEIDATVGDIKNPGTVSTLLNVVVPVSVSAGSLKPAYVMAVVNPTTDGQDEQRSFEQFIGLTRTIEQMTPQPTAYTTSDNIEVKKHDGFTMSNSVYYDAQGDTKPVVAVPIPEDCLFTSAATATASTNKITIYVERVVAKVTVSMNPSDPDFTVEKNTILDTNKEEYELIFTPLAWGVSNVEKGTFITKNFRGSAYGNVEGAEWDNYFSFSNMNYNQARDSYSSLTNPSWNFPSTDDVEGTSWGISGHRSFWAVSPTYFTGGKYPKYSDEITDNGAGTYSLKYHSMNDIYNTKATGANKINRKGAAFGSSLYTLEHTTLAEVVTNQQKRGVSCAIILGQYNLQKKSADDQMPVTTFYIRNGINSDGDAVNVIFPDNNSLMKYVLTANNKIFIENPAYEAGSTDPAKTQYIPVPVNETHYANFEIKHPAKAVTDGSYTPNRYVSLHLKSDKVAAAKYYLRDANGVYTLITTGATGNLADANKVLYGLVNGVEMYNSGYAFFAVPIEHLWRQEDKIGDKDFTAKLGQYGVVRNHIYNIGVDGISGIGTAIGDPDAPIIPNVEQEKYFVKTELYVQRWRIVPDQNVILKP